MELERSQVVLDLAIAFVLWLFGFTLFGRFVVPRWKIGGKFAFYLGVAAMLSYLIGHWSLVWIVGHPLVGIGGHVWWCSKHGIHPVTCTPRDRYLELRPWAREPGE